MSIEKWKMRNLFHCSPVWAEHKRPVAPAERVVHRIGTGISGIVPAVAVLALLSGCMTGRPAPVTERLPPKQTKASPVKPAPRVTQATAPDQPRPDFYTVKAGDTLYSIALEFGLDYRELAAWNNIEPSRIRIGQQLRLSPPGGVVATPLRTPSGAVEAKPLGSGPGAIAGARVEPRGVRVPYSDQAYAQMSGVKPEPATTARPPEQPVVAKPVVAGADDVDWIWPVNGKVVSPFNEASNKGIGIAGKMGQPVMAAGPGRVIFSGTGIRGLGKLIVIKHNEKFLSVYAHNRELLVKEGQTVARGQKIAEMGDTDTDQVKLHFEIRRMGKPVDPAGLLPPG